MNLKFINKIINLNIYVYLIFFFFCLVLGLSNTSLDVSNADKIPGSNITSVNNELPVQGSSGNMSYIGM